MRILLVFPKVRFLDKAGDRPPLGIAYLASYLRANFAQADISLIDFNLYPKMTRDEEINMIASRRPDVVGMSFLTPGYDDARKLAQDIKHQISHKIVLVAGGPHGSAAHRETLESSEFDFVVRGEGEETFAELVDTLYKGRDPAGVRGVSIKNKGNIINTPDRGLINSLDSIPFPAHDFLEMGKYSMEIEGRLATSILSSRGCPHQCIYCSRKVFGSHFRSRSARNIVAEIKSVKNKYNISGFLFVDDTFTLLPEKVNEFCHLVKSEGLDIAWRCWTRSDRVDKKLMETMHSAGCRVVCFGVESGNQRILDMVKKGSTVESNMNAIRWAKEAGLKVKLFIMVGLPGETEAEVEHTIDFVLKSDPDTVDCYIMTPYPHTELWENAAKFGVRIKSFDWGKYFYAGMHGQVPVLIETDKLSGKEIERLYGKMRDRLKEYIL